MGLLDKALSRRKKRIESKPKSSASRFGGYLYYFEEMERLGLNGGMDKEWKNRRLED